MALWCDYQSVHRASSLSSATKGLEEIVYVINKTKTLTELGLMSVFLSVFVANGFECCYRMRQQQRRQREQQRRRRKAAYCGADAGGGSVAGRLVLGLNQYSHDASLCIVEAASGDILFAASKERISRRKHDGGDVGELVRHGIRSVGASLDDVTLVVANNHHFRIAPYEARLPFNVAIGAAPSSSLDPANLLSHVPRIEISHHMAHAWSVAPLSGFTDDTLVVVMDGMGESLRYILASEGDESYFSDKGLPSAECGFVQVPDKEHGMDAEKYGWREGESAYVWSPAKGLQKLFKRWIAERSPPELFNHGFADMESLGAVYSRASSHIYGDWNSCGKVMGLAEWSREWAPSIEYREIMSGPLEDLKIDWGRLSSSPYCNRRWASGDRRSGPSELENQKIRASHTALARDVQKDLERVALEFIARLKQKTNAQTMCFTGGVALNSTLNGRIVRELGFHQVYVPPHPGDEGIAIGCALFGAHHLKQSSASPEPIISLGTNLPRHSGAAKLGRAYDQDEVISALLEFEPWISYEPSIDLNDGDGAISGTQVNSDTTLHIAARTLADGGAIGFFSDRAEFGPRALGSRSILADPRSQAMKHRLNEQVKRREPYRPFAPAVLAEHAHDYFDLGKGKASPFMSFTVPSLAAANAAASATAIPAALHIDGTARLQTVSNDGSALRTLLELFYAETSLPILVNTSFNLAGQPIVENPCEAITTFLDSGLDMLYLQGFIVRRKLFPASNQTGGHQGSSLDINQRPFPGSAYRAEIVESSYDYEEGGSSSPVRMFRLEDNHCFEDKDTTLLDVLRQCNGDATIGEIHEACNNNNNSSSRKNNNSDIAVFEQSLKTLFERRFIMFLDESAL